MANRLVAGDLPGGGQGIRVSVPGQNVLNENLSGKFIAFDTRWLGACRVFRTGSVSLAASGGSSTVMFGETFPTLPAVIAMGRTTVNVSGQQVQVWDTFGNFSNESYTYTSPTAEQVTNALNITARPYADVRDDRVIFTNRNVLTTLVSYVILRV